MRAGPRNSASRHPSRPVVLCIGGKGPDGAVDGARPQRRAPSAGAHGDALQFPIDTSKSGGARRQGTLQRPLAEV